MLEVTKLVFSIVTTMIPVNIENLIYVTSYNCDCSKDKENDSKD